MINGAYETVERQLAKNRCLIPAIARISCFVLRKELIDKSDFDRMFLSKMNPFFSRLILTSTVIATPLSAVDFVHQVAPLLKKHCAECHMGTKSKGGFAMNTREELMRENDNGFVLEPGNSAKSLMMHLITSDDEDERMPPKGDGLNESEVALVAAWINAGAPWEPGFTFKQSAYEPPLNLQRPKIPAAQNGRTHPIDRILDAHLTKTKAVRQSPIEESAFVRRLHLDLTGLLPSHDVLQAYLADKDPQKRNKLIRTLLDDKQSYASHWMTFWNDLLRNDYAGTGYIDGGRKQISQWLYRSLYDNKPYNQFASELIAPNSESGGFAHGIKWRGEVSAGQKVPIQYAQSVGQTFLGINLKCASCHDSFTDQWKLTDSYGLAAAFSADKIEIARCDKPTGKIAEPYWLYPQLGKIDPTQPPAERLKQVAALTTMPENGRFSRTIANRLWHRLMGRGIVHPVDAMGTEPWNADLLDHLAGYLIEQKYDLKAVLAHICESQAYQSKAQTLETDDESKWTYTGPRAKRMTAEEFVDALWQILGTGPSKADFIPGIPAAVSSVKLSPATWIWRNDGVQSPAGETVAFRKTITLSTLPQLAMALVTCDNEFTLSVNGKFAAKGNDWMTPQVVDLKRFLQTGENQIVVIGKNGGSGPNAAACYFQAYLRQGKQDATIVSDVSWQATAAPNGAIPAQAQWTKAVAVPNQNGWDSNAEKMQQAQSQITGSGSLRVRASLMKSDLLMRSLGRPNREQIVTSRPNDLTTLEAMDLNNGAILAAQLEKGAQRLLEEIGKNPRGMVDSLYWQALSRAPSAEEKQIALDVLGAQPSSDSVQDFLWTLFMLPEFQLIR
jgi:mono/diheme cytochrome c family protein